MKLVYQKLTEYLLSKLPQAYHGNLYSWMDEGKIIDEGRTLTHDGQVLFYLRYKVEILFSEFPYSKIDPLRLMALIKLWLDDNDDQRAIMDTHEIDFDLNIIDDEIADLGFSIEITEPIYITETDKNAEIEIDGQGYIFAPPEIQYAEKITLTANGREIEIIRAEGEK